MSDLLTRGRRAGVGLAGGNTVDIAAPSTRGALGKQHPHQQIASTSTRLAPAVSDGHAVTATR